MMQLAASTVPGALEWSATGQERELARPWRGLLVSAAERMAARLAVRVRA